MKVALDNFDSLQRSNKIAMLGGMKELGTDSEKEHKSIVERIQGMNGVCGIFVGPEFQFVQDANSPTLRWFANVHEAMDFFKNNPIVDATILLKGSNGTQMWRLEEVL